MPMSAWPGAHAGFGVVGAAPSGSPADESQSPLCPDQATSVDWVTVVGLREASAIHAEVFGLPRVRSLRSLIESGRLHGQGVAICSVARVPRRSAVPLLAAGFVLLVLLPALGLVAAIDPALTTLGRVTWSVVVTAVTAAGIVKVGRSLLVARRWGWPGCGRSEVSNVASAFPGNGDARSLMEQLAASADRRGEHLMLRVDPSNERAIARYRRAGFVDAGVVAPHGQTVMERRSAGRHRPKVDATRLKLIVLLVVGSGAIAASGATILGAIASGASLAFLALAAAADHATLRIPNAIVVAALLFALVAIDVADAGAAPLVGAGVAALPLLLIHLLDPAALGFGDVKFAVAAGLVVGSVAWPAAVVVPLVGLAGVLVARVARPGVARPFGPYLFVATIVALGFAIWLTSTGGPT